MVLTTPQARRRKANLKAVALEKKSEARNKLLNEQLDGWFDKFDADGDKQFDREELAAAMGVGSIPTLIVFRPQTGEIVTLKGKEDVCTLSAADALAKWKGSH